MTGVQTCALPISLSDARYNATVFCAAAGCDHLDCHGGPFAVALVGSWAGLDCAIGCVYSSEAGEWGEPVAAVHTSRLVGNVFPWGTGSEFASVLVENVFYFICEPMSYPFIVEFDMARGKLSTFDVPSPSLHRKQGRRAETGRLTVTEDGRLGFAYVLIYFYYFANPN